MLLKQQEEIKKRNSDILNDYINNTMTLQEIGIKNNLTRERVRQILTKSDLYLKRLYKVNKKDRIRVFVPCAYCSKDFLRKSRRQTCCDVECKKKLTTRKHQLMTEKKCSKCGIIKPISEFHPKYGIEGRFSPSCKKCFGITLRSWRERNPETWKKINARAMKKFYLSHRKPRFCRKCKQIFGKTKSEIKKFSNGWYHMKCYKNLPKWK